MIEQNNDTNDLIEMIKFSAKKADLDPQKYLDILEHNGFLTAIQVMTVDRQAIQRERREMKKRAKHPR
jgi:hypothetical protein